MKQRINNSWALFFLAFTIFPMLLRGQQKEWENKLRHWGDCRVHAVAYDPTGNTFITGSFTGSVNFPTGILTSQGASDVFTAKYTPKGNLLWAKQAGGGNNEEAYAVTADRHGSVYITGYFSGFLNMDNLALDGSEQETNCFVIKYDNNGFIQWGVRSFGTADKYGKAITTDKEGNVLFAGAFKNEMLFETEDPNEKCEGAAEDEKEGKILKSKSASTIFIAKISSNGELMWLQQSNGKGIHEVSTIKTDEEQNCYVSGTFSDRCSFGNKKLKSRKGKSVFVTKYDSMGNVIWARQSTDTSNDIGIPKDIQK